MMILSFLIFKTIFFISQVSHMVSRDLDSLISAREAAAVSDWLASDKVNLKLYYSWSITDIEPNGFVLKICAS